MISASEPCYFKWFRHRSQAQVQCAETETAGKDPEALLRLLPAEVEVPAHITIQSLRISTKPTSPDFPKLGFREPAKGQQWWGK